MKPVFHPAFSIQRERTPRPLHLTPRERDVLALLCEGLPNKLISRRLNISAATVKCHISRILDELGVSSRLQAVVVAARFGLIEDVAAERSTPAVSPRANLAREAAGDSSRQAAGVHRRTRLTHSNRSPPEGPMTPQQFQKQLETLEQEADAVVSLFSSMPTWRLHMLNQIVSDELALRSEGKPSDRTRLH